MEGAELIIQEINREAEREIERILSEAREEAEKLESEARERAESKAEWILRKARTQAEIERQRIIASAKLEIRKRKLEVQERLISEALEGLKERLRNMPDDEYFDILVDLLRDAVSELGGNEFVVSGNERTLKLLEVRRAELGKEIGDVKLEFGEQVESIGGIIISTPDGRARVDNTFEARMERLRENLRAGMAKILFGAG